MMHEPIEGLITLYVHFVLVIVDSYIISCDSLAINDNIAIGNIIDLHYRRYSKLQCFMIDLF